MRTFVTAALIAISLCLAACNSPTVPPGDYGTVTGIVTSTSGQPVAGVTVWADYGPTSPPTGSDGRYTIQEVPTSSALSGTEIQVHSVPSGYGVPAVQTVQVVAGQTTPNVNFVLPPG